MAGGIRLGSGGLAVNSFTFRLTYDVFFQYSTDPREFRINSAAPLEGDWLSDVLGYTQRIRLFEISFIPEYVLHDSVPVTESPYKTVKKYFQDTSPVVLALGGLLPADWVKDPLSGEDIEIWFHTEKSTITFDNGVVCDNIRLPISVLWIVLDENPPTNNVLLLARFVMKIKYNHNFDPNID